VRWNAARTKARVVKSGEVFTWEWSGFAGNEIGRLEGDFGVLGSAVPVAVLLDLHFGSLAFLLDR
jgi:hypothetical protein